MGRMLGTSWFSPNLYPISSFSQQGSRERFVVTTMSGLNDRKTVIYRPSGGLNNLGSPRHVAKHGRSQPMSMPM
jgi:hypothetical protein